MIFAHALWRCIAVNFLIKISGEKMFIFPSIHIGLALAFYDKMCSFFYSCRPKLTYIIRKALDVHSLIFKVEQMILLFLVIMSRIQNTNISHVENNFYSTIDVFKLKDLYQFLTFFSKSLSI